MLKEGKELIAVLSDVFVHFYDKESFNAYGKDTDLQTGKPITETFDIIVTDKEIVKLVSNKDTPENRCILI